jgi:hypothetical protein
MRPYDYRDHHLLNPNNQVKPPSFFSSSVITFRFCFQLERSKHGREEERGR